MVERETKQRGCLREVEERLPERRERGKRRRTGSGEGRRARGEGGDCLTERQPMEEATQEETESEWLGE